MSLARELKTQEPDCQVVYVGHKGDKFDSLKLSTNDFDFTAFIQAGKFRRYHGESFISRFNPKTFVLNARDFFRVIGSVFASLRILRRVKPDVMFSKGGFVAVPVAIAARILRVPIITHDSDAIPGLANRIVGRWALQRTSGTDSGDPSRTYVGIPINSQIAPLSAASQKTFKKAVGVPPDSLLLLVGGAGNGAQRINDLVVTIAPLLLGNNPGLRIIHFAGQAHESAVREAYHSVLGSLQAKRVGVLGFSDEFYKYSAAADLIISRAGATSIAEFAAAAKACIIIPSPFLAGGHQLKNAELLRDKDAAVVVDDTVQPDELAAIVGELLSDSDRRAQLAANLHGQSVPDAAAKLAKLILKVAKKG